MNAKEAYTKAQEHQYLRDYTELLMTRTRSEISSAVYNGKTNVWMHYKHQANIDHIIQELEAEGYIVEYVRPTWMDKLSNIKTLHISWGDSNA